MMIHNEIISHKRNAIVDILNIIYNKTYWLQKM